MNTLFAMKEWLLRLCMSCTGSRQKATQTREYITPDAWLRPAIGKVVDKALDEHTTQAVPPGVCNAGEHGSLSSPEVQAVEEKQDVHAEHTSAGSTRVSKSIQQYEARENLTLQKLENYMQQNYELRYNILTEQAEFRTRGSEEDFQTVTKRMMNTFVLHAHKKGICAWDVDMNRFLNSCILPDFHPMISYMNHLPEWDGHDRVTPLAQRISSDVLWMEGFHTWLLCMAAQWEGRRLESANSLAPILISVQQGKRKSTFCRLLLPPQLRNYYTDHFELTSKGNCEQRLANTALINLDEFDRFPDSQMPFLKNLMQMNASNFRKMRTERYLNLPRMASFIGTSNRRDILSDPSGSRRFLCWEVEDNIDCSPIEHDQLFAQLHYELEHGARTWLTPEHERQLENHNQAFQRYLPEEEAFMKFFRRPEGHEPTRPFTISQIYQKLSSEMPKVMRGISCYRLSRSIARLGIKPRHTRAGNVYDLVIL